MVMLTHWSKTIDFIEEDDGGLCLLSFLEQQAKLALGFAHPLGQHIRALAHEEGHLGARLAGCCCQRPSH